MLTIITATISNWNKLVNSNKRLRKLFRKSIQMQVKNWGNYILMLIQLFALWMLVNLMSKRHLICGKNGSNGINNIVPIKLVIKNLLFRNNLQQENFSGISLIAREDHVFIIAWNITSQIWLLLMKVFAFSYLCLNKVSKKEKN